MSLKIIFRMTRLTESLVEVHVGDLIKVETLHNKVITYYLVLGIEPTEDPKLVSYKAIADGRLTTFRRWKKYIARESVISCTEA